MRRLAWLFAVAFLAINSAAHAQWGDLKAKFVVDRHVPQKPIAGAVVPPLLAGVVPVDESLIVAPAGELKNVVAWLLPPADKKVPIHPDYEALPAIDLDIKNCAFSPHVIAIRTGQDLTVHNRDPIGHAVKFDLLAAPAGAIVPGVIMVGGSAPFKFAAEERIPSPVSSPIFPWMSGHIVIREDPYVAISGDDGTLTLKNVPAGEWTFVVWHERCGYVREATIDDKEVEWKKGRVKVTIRDGETTDLGTATISAEFLKRK